MRKEDISYDKDDLKVIVDDKKLDINVLEYIEVKEKYDFYLRCIKYFNNFMTFEHLNWLLKDDLSRGKIFKDINTLCDLSFLKKAFIGKNSYYLLTKKANIYLNQKNEGGYIKNPSNRSMINNLLITDYILFERKDDDAARELSDNIYRDILNNKKLHESINKSHLKIYEVMKSLKLVMNDISDIKNVLENQIKLLNENEGDILSKLKSKNAYIESSEVIDGILILEIIVLDNENYSTSKFKNLLIDIAKIIKELYITAYDPEVKYNISIIAIDAIRKNELEASLSKKIELKYFKYLNEYNVFTYDTMRFFRYKNDQIKTIDSSEINVIELALKQG